MFGLGKLLHGLDLPANLAQALMGVPADPRKEFCAILMATAASAAQSQNFNLETEINDLWIRLRNIETSGSPGILNGVVGQLGAGMSELNVNLTKAVMQLSK